MFSDHHHYETKFSGRLGFARIAKETQVPIIPIFTRNIREAFRQVPIMKNFVKFIYNRYRIPLFLTYGGMPVKLTTIIGEPIRFESDATIEQIAEMVIVSIFFLLIFLTNKQTINLITAKKNSLD